MISFAGLWLAPRLFELRRDELRLGSVAQCALVPVRVRGGLTTPFRWRSSLI
jgi:hypothetical protein